MNKGIWNDVNQNTDGDISNARIYQTVTLEPGRYYFGATYNTTYATTNEAYIFVAPQTMATSEIPQYSIAYYPINKAPDNNDGSWHGVFFTLEEETEVVLGFQADLTKGSSTKEFRAKKLALLSYNGPTAIESVEKDAPVATPNFNAPAQYYSITGVQLNEAPRHGMFIMCQNGNTYKLYRK